MIPRWSEFSVHPLTPFRIARGSTAEYRRVYVRLRVTEAGPEGWGEAAPSAFYGEDAASVQRALERLEDTLSRWDRCESLADLEALEDALRRALPGDASARAAVSAAAHDLLGKKLGRPVFELLGLDPNAAPPSSFTISIPDTGADLTRRVEEADAYPILKVKLGGNMERDEWIARAVRRAAPRKLLRADANAAWTLDQARRMAAVLADLGFELLEQPLAKDDLDGFRRLRGAVFIPVIADESCVDSRDIPALDGAVDGVNIKLAKCGGLAEARRMANEARARGMRVMLGCMIESSLGVTAAAHLAPLADFLDLDGAALLADDPFIGATIAEGVLRLPSAPGLGVAERLPA